MKFPNKNITSLFYFCFYEKLAILQFTETFLVHTHHRFNLHIVHKVKTKWKVCQNIFWCQDHFRLPRYWGIYWTSHRGIRKMGILATEPCIMEHRQAGQPAPQTWDTVPRTGRHQRHMVTGYPGCFNSCSLSPSLWWLSNSLSLFLQLSCYQPTTSLCISSLYVMVYVMPSFLLVVVSESSWHLYTALHLGNPDMLPLPVACLFPLPPVQIHEREKLMN